MRVLVACEFSGIVRDAFRALGHDAWSCDLLPCERGPDYHFQLDVREVLSATPPWDLMIAHPPCQYLSWAGNVWLKQPGRLVKRQAAWEFFQALWSSPIKRVAVENPPGYPCQQIAPSQTIQPWQFGHPVSKKTCLWLKGLETLKPANIVELPAPHHDGKRNRHWVDTCVHGWDQEARRKHRSRTFPGIAAAMAEQWGGLATGATQSTDAPLAPAAH